MSKIIYCLILPLVLLLSSCGLIGSIKNRIPVPTNTEEPYLITELGGKESKNGESAKGTNELIAMFENDETFVVIFGGTDCTLCKSFNKNVLNVYLDSKTGEKYQDDIYYYYSNQFIEYLNDLYEDVNEAEVKELAKKYEEKLMLNHFIPAYEEFYGEEYTTKSTVGNIEFYSAETPVLLFVFNGNVMGMIFGDISGESNAVLHFSEALTAWENNDTNAFKAVLEKIN